MPCRQARQQSIQRRAVLLAVDLQRTHKPREIAALNRAPEHILAGLPRLRMRGGAPVGRRSKRGVAVEPVAPALEGVARKLHPPGSGLAQQRGPGDRRSACPQLGQRRDERGRLRPSRFEGRHSAVDAILPRGRRIRRVGRVAKAFPRYRAEHAVRANLEETAHAVGVKPTHSVGETHGLAHVPDPVGRRAQLLRRGLTGEIGHDGYPRPGERNVAGDLGEVLEHAVHPR